MYGIFLTQIGAFCYLLPNEEAPYRATQSKSNITKVMFMAVVARPRFDTERQVFFDGTIGLFPFVSVQPAVRNSKIRPKGTPVTKPVNANSDVYVKMMKEKVLPAIRRLFPRKWEGKTFDLIVIQEDNAKAHSWPNEAEKNNELTEDGFATQIIKQPLQSPDFNVLDLGLLRSIQALQQEQMMTYIEDVIAATQTAFEDVGSEQSNCIFLTLQQCMTCAMQVDGGNNYALPHMGKLRLANAGELPTALRVPSEVFVRAVKLSRGSHIEEELRAPDACALDLNDQENQPPTPPKTRL
jgi:hypothetical protein